MEQENTVTKLYNVGISYKKADVKVRGTFSITKENQILLLEDAKQNGIEGLFVLSTCNRTEITGFAKHPFELISLLIKYSNGSVESFIPVSNVYKNKDAVEHLFRIGTGLESQILGDYEIVGQLKAAYKQAKKLGTTNAYLERLMNLVLQASKDVKNNTKLSSGTTSVAYAAIQYIIDNVQDYNNKNILIYGLGKIGQNTIKNILEYTNNKSLTVINRTQEKAVQFASEFSGIKVADFNELENEIEKSDILIVSTGSSKPTVTVNQLKSKRPNLVIDLSIPSNVDLAVKELENTNLINVDELSEITDKTLQIRENEIPHTEEIIKKYKAEFNEWISIRKYVPAVNALKESLKAIQYDEIDFHSRKIKDFNVEQAELVTSRMIQKITTQFVKHLKDENTSVDQSIEVISKMFHINELSIHENN
ncbi:MAG: glutamyl-tRNA reductase [Lutibacter sp.]|jgi:glutamyl-tRNA reductase|uniref:glutamyl-tRNA reductase n=1 Tax=Lutibacter sp. TaxID=1925666 RepID=UPI00299CF7E2|nr:glutamyl-tRNA reductase [Lutibacter sp.]MDX1829066.1 glutamyl-tRNA reductase [Lutibacter sp.]